VIAKTFIKFNVKDFKEMLFFWTRY